MNQSIKEKDSRLGWISMKSLPPFREERYLVQVKAKPSAFGNTFSF